MTLGFDVQERPGAYFYLCCRTCRMTFYLPKNAATKEAHTILAAHAAAHLSNQEGIK
jgi:hypothetical protein